MYIKNKLFYLYSYDTEKIAEILENDKPDFSNENIQGGITLTQSVNSGDVFMLGSNCCSEIEFTVIDTNGAVKNFNQLYGDLTDKEFIYIQEIIDDNGSSTSIQHGYFTIYNAEKVNSVTWNITAYDRMMRFERVIDDFISALPESITLYGLITNLCLETSVELNEQTAENILNADFAVSKNFNGSNITARDLIYWIGEVAGCYSCFDENGKLLLKFYSETANEINNTQYFSLETNEYSTVPITAVQIRVTDSDIGVVKMADGLTESANAYVIQDNPLLYTDNTADLEPIAENLFARLENFSYTPFSCDIINEGKEIFAGEYINIISQDNTVIKTIITEKVTSGGKISICANGDNSSNNLKSKNISITMLNGKTNELERTIESTISRLTDVYTENEEIIKRISAVEQNAESVNLTFQKIGLEGVSEDSETNIKINLDGIDVGSDQTDVHTQMKPEEFTISQGNNIQIRVNSEGTVLQNTIIQDDLTVGTVKMIDRENGIDFVVLGGE